MNNIKRCNCSIHMDMPEGYFNHSPEDCPEIDYKTGLTKANYIELNLGELKPLSVDDVKVNDIVLTPNGVFFKPNEVHDGTKQFFSKWIDAITHNVLHTDWPFTLPLETTEDDSVSPNEPIELNVNFADFQKTKLSDICKPMEPVKLSSLPVEFQEELRAKLMSGEYVITGNANIQCVNNLMSDIIGDFSIRTKYSSENDALRFVIGDTLKQQADDVIKETGYLKALEEAKLTGVGANPFFIDSMPYITEPRPSDHSISISDISSLKGISVASTGPSSIKDRYRRVFDHIVSVSKECTDEEYKELLNGNLCLRSLRNETGLWADYEEDESWLIDGVQCDPNHPDNLSSAVYKYWLELVNLGILKR